VVRADLCDRLAALRNACGARRGGDLTERLDAIGRLASAYGLHPVARLAAAMRASSADSTSRAVYLDRLEDAIGCTRFESRRARRSWPRSRSASAPEWKP
jgi:hypothetical protein